jgi:hypothetical protein
LQGRFEESGRWLIRSVSAFLEANDQHVAGQGVQNFLIVFRLASSEEKQKLEAIWREANLGEFPSQANES